MALLFLYFSEINAFIYDATVLEYLAGHDDGCKLRTVGNWYAMTGYGLGFPQGSKWLEVVNKYLIELQHNGKLGTAHAYNVSQSTRFTDAGASRGLSGTSREFMTTVQGVICFSWT